MYYVQQSKLFKMRTTKFYKGYGFITTGEGIFSNIVKGITSIATSPKTKDIIVEGSKAAAKSFGDKAGSHLGDKIVSNSKKSKAPTILQTKAQTLTKSSTKTPHQRLKAIYGESVLTMQRGGGIQIK